MWLAGNALRLTILAVPPVIPLIHDDLHMSATQVGILTGLPSLLLALAAVPGSLLIARTGVLAALTIGLLLNAVGGALRGAINDVLWLYAMTIVMGAGVAIMQVAMPPAVRAWVPQRRIAFATAVYTNGLLIGEILPVALMLPLVLPLVGTGNGASRSGARRSRSSPCWCCCLRRAPRTDEGRQHQPPLVAGLERSADLAARHHARHRERDVFRHQRVHPGFSDPPRPGRMDQRGADRAQSRAIARLVHLARLRQPLAADACGRSSRRACFA